MGVALIWRDALFLSRFVDDAPSVRYDAGLFLDAAAASLRPGANGHGGTQRRSRCRSRNGSSVM
jgi:hypothetical protein